MSNLTNTERTSLPPLAGRTTSRLQQAIEGLEHLAEQLNASFERHGWRWVGCFIAILMLCSLAIDLQRKMWYDELYTYHLAALPSVSAIINSNDVAPPFYSILVHLLLKVIPIDALAVRLMSTLGFGAMVLFVFALCRRLYSGTYAVLAALLACFLNGYYATEGRAYGLALGCVAGALYSWDAAARGEKRGLHIPLLALYLAALPALHYYAIFVLVPLFAGEVARWWKTRKIDFAMLSAGAAPLLVMALHYPMIKGARAFMGHYWSTASWADLGEFYGKGDALIPLLCVLTFLLMLFLPAKEADRTEKPRLDGHEWTAFLGLALLPVCVLAVAFCTTHVFVGRYVTWAQIGIALIFVGMLQIAMRSNKAIALILVLVLLFANAARVTSYLKGKYDEVTSLEQELAALPETGEPIVVNDPRAFLELVRHARPKLRARLVYPLDHDLDLRYWGSDTDFLLLTELHNLRQLSSTVEFSEFVATQPRFILFARSYGYLPWHLVSMGYSVKPLRQEKSPQLFEVHAPSAR